MTTTATATRKSVIAKAMGLDIWSEEEHEVLSKMYASITAPRKKSDEPTKTQLLNQNLAAKLVECMREYGEPVDSKWVMNHVNGILTPQKAVAVIKAADDQIIKFYEGRNVFYKLAQPTGLWGPTKTPHYFTFDRLEKL